MKLDANVQTVCTLMKIKFDGDGKLKMENAKETAENSLSSSELNIFVLKEEAMESSYEFWKDGEKDIEAEWKSQNDGGVRGGDAQDALSKLIGQFLHKQRASGDCSLDMDLEMDELSFSDNKTKLPLVAKNPSDFRLNMILNRYLINQNKRKCKLQVYTNAKRPNLTGRSSSPSVESIS